MGQSSTWLPRLAQPIRVGVFRLLVVEEISPQRRNLQRLSN